MSASIEWAHLDTVDRQKNGWSRSAATYTLAKWNMKLVDFSLFFSTAKVKKNNQIRNGFRQWYLKSLFPLLP